MRVVCTHCDHNFEAAEEDPRCPVCLRKRTMPASRKHRPAPVGLNTIEGSQDEPVAPLPSRPLPARIGRFFARAAIGALIFAVLTLNGKLLGMELGGAGFRLYAIVIGGLALGAAWSIFPSISPIYRE
jgi:hypothetical protein